MRYPDEVSVGWTVYEPVPFDAEYTGRGGVVTRVHRSSPDDGEEVLSVETVKIHHGRLLWATLDADGLDWDTLAPPSLGELVPIVRMMAREVGRGSGRAMSEPHRRLVLQAAELAGHL